MMSTEQQRRMEHPYASYTAMNDVQVVDVMETTSNLQQLMVRCIRSQHRNGGIGYGFAPTSASEHRDCSRGTVRRFLDRSTRKHRRRGTYYWRRRQGKERYSREIGCCRRGHGGRISVFERSMKCQIANICSCLEGRGVGVGRVAPVGFDHDWETLTSLARRNITESVGVVGNTTYLW